MNPDTNTNEKTQGCFSKKAVIIYHSKRGTTKKFAKNICEFLKNKDVEGKIIAIENLNLIDLENIDYLFLGCWTSGYIIFGQKPDIYWYKFSEKLPDLQKFQVCLFTTYKIATGSMYKNLKISLKSENKDLPFLKSRNGELNIKITKQLNEFV